MTINGLLCKLLAKKGKKAEIEIEGQKIAISVEHLPCNISPGNSFRLYFLSEKESVDHQKELAQKILEEILNGK